jgi:hypothetical protein
MSRLPRELRALRSGCHESWTGDGLEKQPLALGIQDRPFPEPNAPSAVHIGILSGMELSWHLTALNKLS